jgi:hypothetical protein
MYPFLKLRDSSGTPFNMKVFLPFVCFILVFATAARGETDFAGLEKAMDSDTYERAGIRKLSDEERAVLDQFIRNYVSGKQKAAATAAATDAVNKAIQEHKVEPPDITESRIVGTFKGYGPRTVFRLENGQVWKPTNESASSPAIENPRVIIFKDFFGYKMFIEGASTLRVKRVL